MHDINCYVTVCSSKLISILLLPIISFAALGYRLIYLCSTSVPLFERVLLILGDKIKVWVCYCGNKWTKINQETKSDLQVAVFY